MLGVEVINIEVINLCKKRELGQSSYCFWYDLDTFALALARASSGEYAWPYFCQSLEFAFFLKTGNRRDKNFMVFLVKEVAEDPVAAAHSISAIVAEEATPL